MQADFELKSLQPLSKSLLNECFETERLEDRNEGTAQRQVFAAITVAAETWPASDSAQLKRRGDSKEGPSGPSFVGFGAVS
ncbi:hypothetical protein [Rahnella contaminans]|uniref:hypothetical protein n=1 Tax=Rahnella contaminans TaxID=2703882 RepID=UPI0023DC9E12|nr:hypothetical protein [Rahnella contaminans]MDF1893986.1 hypothetical protein [Rahnella contaminans]